MENKLDYVDTLMKYKNILNEIDEKISLATKKGLDIETVNIKINRDSILKNYHLQYDNLQIDGFKLNENSKIILT